MENQELIEEKIKTHPDIDIIKPNKTVPMIILIIGVAALLCGIVGFISSKAVNIALIISGIAVIILGIVQFINVSKEHFIHKSSEKKIKKYRIFLNQEGMQKIDRFIKEKENHSLESIQKEMNANKLLVVMSTDDASFMLAQLFEYIPYVYEPTSSVYHLSENKAKKLLDFCKK